LAKKKTTASPRADKKHRPEFDFEKSPYTAPFVFGAALVGIIILFGEFIFSGKIFYSADMMQAGIFFRSFYVNYVLTHGAVPQWNPYIFGGLPFVEAFHGDLFYPLSALKFFGTLFRMLSYNLILHIFLSGVFTYFCARQFKLSKIASLLSGLSYMFAGYLMSLVAPWHDGKIFVTTLFPLTILFLDRGFEKKPLLNFSILGLVIGLIILTPHPQLAYFSLWAVSFYAAFKLIVLWREKKSILPCLKPAALTTYAVIIGLAISAIQFYPGFYYTSNYSPRSESKRGWDWATSWSLHEEEAFSMIIPEFAGTHSATTGTYYWGKNPFKDNSETVGVVCFFIALIGLFFYRRKESYFLGGLALFALIYGLAATTPVFRIFFWLIPMVKSLRAPSMIMFLFSFSAAILAGMGLQFVIDRSRELKAAQSKKFHYLLFGWPAFMLLLALLFTAAGKGMLNLWSSVFYSEAPTIMVQQGVSKLDLAYANLPAIQSGAWLAFLFTALAAGCIWMYQSRKFGAAILVALLAIPVIDGIRFNRRFVNLADPLPYLSSNPIVEFFKQDKSLYRVQSFSQQLPINFPYHGIQLVVGYHGNQLKWYDRLLGGPALSNQGNARFLNLAGAKYLIIGQDQKIPDGYFGGIPTTSAMNFRGMQIIRNDNAFPRVFLADRYRLFDDPDNIYLEVLNGSDDMRRIVYLEEDPGIELSPDSTVSDSAWVIEYETDSVLVGLNCTRNHLLVMTDNWYGAWHALIDGQPARLLRSYSTFRAVAVPAGTKTVAFKYHSERYVIGRMMTWVASLYLLVIFAFYIIAPRLKKREPAAD